MIELDEYEMDGIAKLLHIAKRFADRGRLDLLLQASGKDAILSVETYLELEYDLPCLIFEDVTVQRHPEDDWRMFSERTVYIMRDSLLSRFDQLCREYEATRGILPIENPFVSTLEEAVNRALRMNSYSYDYCLYDSLRDKKGPKLVLISGPTRSLNIRNCEKQPDFPHCCSAFPITLTGLIRPTTNWALTIGI